VCSRRRGHQAVAREGPSVRRAASGRICRASAACRHPHGHRGESLEIRACARDLRLCMDPENAPGGPNPQKSRKTYPGAICLGPWTIAVNSPADRTRRTRSMKADRPMASHCSTKNEMPSLPREWWRSRGGYSAVRPSGGRSREMMKGPITTKGIAVVANLRSMSDRSSPMHRRLSPGFETTNEFAQIKFWGTTARKHSIDRRDINRTAFCHKHTNISITGIQQDDLKSRLAPWSSCFCLIRPTFSLAKLIKIWEKILAITHPWTFVRSESGEGFAADCVIRHWVLRCQYTGADRKTWQTWADFWAQLNSTNLRHCFAVLRSIS